MTTSKYKALTEWLIMCDKNTVKITLDTLNNIMTIPRSAYKDRSSWANCTTKNSTAFQRGWLDANYQVSKINLQEQWVEFSKISTPISTNTQNFVALKVKVPTSYEEELLLTIPHNLIDLTKDEFLMVRLTKENSDIVESCIQKDALYQSKGKGLVEKHFNNGNYSKEAYEDIIRCIAVENSTRTSKATIELLASYCTNDENLFLERIKQGDTILVDDLIEYLIRNGSKKAKSLASKLCRYLNEWLYNDCAYTINDSVVRTILPYYLAYYKIDRALWKDKNFDKLSYKEFYALFSMVRDTVKELNNHQLDHLIWYSYKNDTIRSEIAKALSQIL